MRKLNLIIGVLALSFATYALAASVLGRMELTYPDLGDPAGITQVQQQQDSIEALSDNMPARISEFTGIADNTVITITHNFGLNSGSLGVLLYDGVGDSKVNAQISLSGFTIVDNLGDPKNKIDVTTPIAGGTHDFSVIVSWGSGGGSSGGGGGSTFGALLFEDIAANTLVRVVDDGGQAKIANIKFKDTAQNLISNEVNLVSAAAQYGTAHKAFSTADNTWVVGGYSGNTTALTLETFQADGSSLTDVDQGSAGGSGNPGQEGPCISYDPVQDLFLVGFNTGGSGNVTLRTFSVSAGVISFNSTVNIALSADANDTWCSLTYDPVSDKHLMIYRRNTNNTYMFTMNITATIPNTFSPIVLVDAADTRDYRSIYSAAHSQHFAVSQQSDGSCNAYKITLSGATPSLDSLIDVPGTTCVTSDLIIDPVSDKVIAVFPGLDGVGKMAHFTLSAGAPVIGNLVTVDGAVSLNNVSFLEVGYDSTDSKIYVSYQADGSTSVFVNDLIVSGLDLVPGVSSSINTTFATADFGSILDFPITEDIYQIQVTQANDGQPFPARTLSSLITVDVESAIGIIEEAGLSGTVGTAILTGGTSETFTGETIGGSAYVQSDGTAGSGTAFLIDGSNIRVGTFLDDSNLFLNEIKLEIPQSIATYGTWTPTLIGSSGNPSLSYISQTGSWAKIDRVVTVYFSVVFTGASSGAGELRIPLPIDSDGFFYGSVVSHAIDFDNGYTSLTVQAATSHLTFKQVGDNVSTFSLQVSNIAGGTKALSGTITYFSE